MNCSTPRSFVLCYLPEFAQTHVHWVCDAIQLSHPLSLPSNPAFNLSQHHDLFQLIDSAGGNLQHQSFQWIFRVDLLSDWLVWPPCCSRDSRESSPAPQFKSTNSWTLSLLYDLTLTSVFDYWKNHSSDNRTDLDGLSADWDAGGTGHWKEVSWDHWLLLSHPVTLPQMI